jgi:hypothetical protein
MLRRTYFVSKHEGKKVFPKTEGINFFLLRVRGIKEEIYVIIGTFPCINSFLDSKYRVSHN